MKQELKQLYKVDKERNNQECYVLLARTSNNYFPYVLMSFAKENCIRHLKNRALSIAKK